MAVSNSFFLESNFINWGIFFSGDVPETSGTTEWLAESSTVAGKEPTVSFHLFF